MKAVFVLQMRDQSVLSSKIAANAPSSVCDEVYTVWVGEVAECAFWSVFFIHYISLWDARVLCEMLS